MDNPDRVLSSERDFIFVPQAEELTESEWEVLGTRCTGRAAVVANAQIFGDCNPSGTKHWIRTRKSLRLLTATHKDNRSFTMIAVKSHPKASDELVSLKNH